LLWWLLSRAGPIESPALREGVLSFVPALREGILPFVRIRPCSSFRHRCGSRRAPYLLAVFGAVLATLAATPESATAGAWTQARGSLYNRTSSNRYTSEDEFDVDRKRHQLPFHGEFVDLNFTDYIEVGATDRFTVFGSFVAKRLRSENDIRETKSWGIGDIDLGVRAKLLEGPSGVVSLQALAKLPTGYDKAALLPLGTGEPELEGRLLYGRSLWPLVPGYCGLEAGFRRRSGRPEDEFRYLAEIGSDLGASFYVRAKLDGIHGLETGNATDASGNPTVRNSYDLGTLDVTAGRRLGRHLAVEAGFAPGLYGRTTSAGSTLNFAVVFTLMGLFAARGPGGGAAE
jgi:hypothetical protein